jgi:iron complex transport system ATP-binding protein
MSPREKARRVALVPQGSSLEFRFTVLETVLMGRYPWLGRFAAESARDHEIARQVIGEVGLAAFCDRPVTALSGGELQRVLVARALCQDTPALLLDEPVSHLDIRHQVDILSTVRRRADERGVTVLCVLHDLNLAARFAHRMVVMKDGRVVAEGVPDHVLDPALIGEVYGLPVTRIDAGDRPVLIPG